MDLVEKEFNGKAIVRGGIHLFSWRDALDLIKCCHLCQRKILGIDSFRITEHTIQPVLEHSVDFSIKGKSEGNWLEAENFIKERVEEELVFEIVYE